MFAPPFSLASLVLNRLLWKAVAFVILLVAVYAAGHSRGYDSGYEVASKKFEKEVAAAKLERDSWKTDFQVLDADVKAKLKAWASAVAEQKAEHERVLSEISTKLERYRRENAKLKGELSDTRKFVSVAADRACVVPTGFVWLHNAAASRSSAAIPASAAPGTPGNADTPSGIALSQVAETTAYNYALANDWRVQLIAWQDWYGEWQKWYSEWAARQKTLDKPPPGG
jgi:hypothetical protein